MTVKCVNEKGARNIYRPDSNMEKLVIVNNSIDSLIQLSLVVNLESELKEDIESLLAKLLNIKL